jgi:hypothetical protein
MTDAGIKKLLGVLLRNKEIAYSLLNSFKAEDMERGILAIPESMINRDFKMLIMDKASPFLNDYLMTFQQNSIYMELDGNAKQLGRIKAMLMLTFESFEFRNGIHRMTFTYHEDIKSEGNFVQSMALKAAGLKGSYLQTAAEMAKFDWLAVAKDTLTIDIDSLEIAKKIPPSLELDYLSSEDGILKFKFMIH